MNAVKYAETVLGVHVPWDEARDKLNLHEESSKKLTSCRSQLRHVKEAIEDRKQIIIGEAPSRPDWPIGVTAQKDSLKVLFAIDTELSSLDQTVLDLQETSDTLEKTIKHCEVALHVLTARMEELGGLLNFYAAAKNAEQTIEHKEIR